MNKKFTINAGKYLPDVYDDPTDAYNGLLQYLMKNKDSVDQIIEDKQNMQIKVILGKNSRSKLLELSCLPKQLNINN